MGRKQMISLNCSIFIFQSMIFALVYASSVAGSNKEDSITVCKDLIGLAERIAILETKQNIYTEDRQRLTRLETRYIEDRQQLFRYFELLNETTKRQMNIEKENDMLKRALDEMRREQNEMKLNMEELTNTVQKLKLEISNVSQQSNENYDNLTVIVNEVKSNMEEQIKDVTEIHNHDNTTLFDIVQKVKYDVDEEHMANQQQTNQQHNLSSTIKEIRRSVQQIDAAYKQKINEIDGNIQSKFANVDQSFGISDQRIQTLTPDVSLLQSKYNADRKKIAFTAKMKGDPRDLSADTIIPYKQWHTNIGGGFNDFDSKFYCPESGLYLISASLESFQPARVMAHIMKNVHVIGSMIKGSSSEVWDMSSVTLATNLQRGDTVWVKKEQAAHVGGISMLTGVLIS